MKTKQRNGEETREQHGGRDEEESWLKAQCLLFSAHAGEHHQNLKVFYVMPEPIMTNLVLFLSIFL